MAGFMKALSIRAYFTEGSLVQDQGKFGKKLITTHIVTMQRTMLNTIEAQGYH